MTTRTQRHYASELESASRIILTQDLKPVASKVGHLSIFGASVLAEAVLFMHLLWCAWVLLGWTVTHCRPGLRTLHIASLIYAIVIELVPWPPCPLTVAETWLETRAGIEPAHGPFLLRVLDAAVYPDLPEWLVVGGAVLVCASILALYVRRYLRRSPAGRW